jgi:hypothetical protein
MIHCRVSTGMLMPVIAVLVTLLNASPVESQVRCRDAVRAGRGDYDYGPRSRHCEGSCGWLASNTTALRVVGFSRGPVFLPGATPPELAVRWSAPLASGGTVRVSAVEGRRCYQMDAEASGNAFRWGTGILNALQVRTGWLAAVVYARTEVNGNPDSMLVPTEAAGGSTPDAPPVVDVVPGRRFTRVTFTIHRGLNGPMIGREHVVPEAWFPANERFRFQLPPDLPRETRLWLRIVGEHEDGYNLVGKLFWIPR